MKIIPFNKLIDIPTENPYKGLDGFIDINSKQTTLDIAELFPFHIVDNGSLKNIRSHILKNQIRIYYFENNIISGIEILAPFEDDHLSSLFLGKCSLFGKSLTEIKIDLENEGFELVLTNVGFDLKNGAVSFYSHSYEESLDVQLDAVFLKF